MFQRSERSTFENNVGKGENAENQHFTLSHNVIYPLTRYSISTHFDASTIDSH